MSNRPQPWPRQSRSKGAYLLYGGSLKWGYPQSSSTCIGVSIINHSFWGSPIYKKNNIYVHYHPAVLFCDDDWYLRKFLHPAGRRHWTWRRSCRRRPEVWNACWRPWQPKGKPSLRWIWMWYPICSMYGIFTYIGVIFRANVGKYTIHGACAYY